MNRLRRIVKSLSPFAIRRRLRRAYRGPGFRRAMERFLEDPGACADPENPVVRDLIHGWANKGWSARHEYLVRCMELAQTSRGPILECGSGLSTLVVGAIARERGQTLWALEHMPEWAARVRRHLDEYGLDSVVLCESPLKNYGDFCWYDAPLESMPDNFSLVLCDGPPGGSRGGRYGLAAIMRERLKPGCVILLDDAGREHERATARRWEAELGASSEILGSEKPYIEMTVSADSVEDK